VSKVVNSSQSLSMSFAYIATPSGKESFQLFRVVVAMFSEEGKCCSVIGAYWQVLIPVVFVACKGRRGGKGCAGVWGALLT